MEISDVVDEMESARSMFAFMATALHALNPEALVSLNEQEIYGMHELFSHIGERFGAIQEALEAMESKGVVSSLQRRELGIDTEGGES